MEEHQEEDVLKSPESQGNLSDFGDSNSSENTIPCQVEKERSQDERPLVSYIEQRSSPIPNPEIIKEYDEKPKN